MQRFEIFRGYYFTGGRIFDFPIDFCMGLQQRSANALPVIIIIIMLLYYYYYKFVILCQASVATVNHRFYQSLHILRFCQTDVSSVTS